MKCFPAKLTAQRWVKAVRQLLGGINDSPATIVRKAPSARLGVEMMEDRVTPAQIGQFSFASNNDYINTNNSPTNDTFVTGPGGSSGLFQYQNIANLPGFLSGPLAAHLVLNASTTTSATNNAGLINQPFPTAQTIQVLLNTPAPSGAGSKTNLISATFTGNLTSTAGQASATLNSATVTFTSDFLDFRNTTFNAFSLGFSNMRDLSGVDTVSSIVGNFINSFTAAGTATFSTTPNSPLIGADLAITKSGPATVAAGGTIAYTYTVTNNGPVAATNVHWTDTLPAGETFVSQTQDSGPAFTLSNTGNAIDNTIASLAVGATATFTVNVNVANSASGTLTNTAVVYSADNPGQTGTPTLGDPDTTNNSSTVNTIVSTNPTLTLGKSGPSTVLAGNTITYTLTVENTSNQTATNVQVQDSLPAGETFVSQSQGGGPTFSLNNTGNAINNTIASLAPGASQTFTIVARVPASTLSGTFTNSGTVNWNVGNPNPGTDTSPSVVTTVSTEADLSVTKSATPVVLVNGDISYTITVANNGPSDAQTVIVSDALPAGTVFVSNSGAAGWTASNPAVGANGTVTESIATLAAGASATFTVVVTNTGNAAGSTISNTATIGSATADSDTDNNSDTATTSVQNGAALSGTVFADFNNDAIMNGSDAGLTSVTLTLMGNLGNTYTVMTGAGGTYNFTNLVPDTYMLTQSGPISPLLQGKNSLGTGATTAGTLTNPVPYNPKVNGIVLSAGDTAINYNFAAIPSATVRGIVFDDSAENDAAFNSGTNPGINGVTVALTGTDDQGTAVNLTTTTSTIAGQAGSFVFTGLRPSNGAGYTITETQPGTYVQGQFDTPGSPLFGGTASQTATQDVITGVVVSLGSNISDSPVVSANYLFPEIQAASVAGLVYSDVDNSGGFNSGDTGINGVLVTLTGTDINGNAVSVTATTATIAGQAGSYAFTGLAPSNGAGYTITETQPSAFLEGTDNIGSLSGNATVKNVFSGIVVAAGANGVNYNFGEVQVASLAGVVYSDTDNGGTLNGGDTGINGVTVTLTGTDDLGNAVNLTTTTSTIAGQAGSYIFSGLRPSNGAGYTITETQPSAFLEGTDNIGSLSGNATVKNVFSAISVTPGANGVNYNFGEVQASSISGVVFDDSVENDGLFNSGTNPGIDGVTVTLTGTDDLGNAVNLTTTTSTIAGQAGSYNFTGLRPSNGAGYTVTDTNTGLPAVFLVGRNQNTGSLGGNLTNQFAKVITSVPVGAGQSGINYNFGQIRPNTLSGIVYIDSNTNGSFTAGEPGINAVTVTLTGTDDLGNAVNLTTTTSTIAGQAGSYNFTGLRPSNGAGYTLTETQPVQYSQGTDTIGTPFGGNPASQTATTDTVTGIVIGVGNANGVNYNFGELGASISGSVFNDAANNDGLRQAGEPGINGVTVTLTGTDIAGNPVNLTTTTSGLTPSDGFFSFGNLPASNSAGYTLTETQPIGFVQGQDNAGTFGGNTSVQDRITRIVVRSGTNGIDYTFGELPTTQISGVVFDDSTENNGTFNSATNPGINGVTVTLTGTDINGNAVSLTTTTSTIAGQAGSYIFTGLVPSDQAGYTITETQPSAFLQGGDELGTLGGNPAVQDVFSGVVATAGANGTNYNFGELRPAQVTGFVYVDANTNNAKDTGEPGLPSVTVVLSGIDDRGQAVNLTQQTQPDGSFTFSNLRPSGTGGYTLTETQPAGYLQAGNAAGSLTGNTTVQDVISAIPVRAGDSGTGYLFGERAVGSVGGVVYYDKNQDGVFQSGTDEPLSGVVVTIRDSNNNVVGTRTTGTDGAYSFTGLPAGTYTITESQPTGYGSSEVPTNVRTVTLGSADVLTGLNFGNTLGTISGIVYRDFDLNGVRTTSGANPDTGIAGVTITLRDGNGNVLRTIVTGSDGTYSFGDLPVGNYMVTETQPPTPTTLTNGFYDGADNLGSLGGTNTPKNKFSLTLGTDATTQVSQNGTNYNFGELPPADPFGFVYVDQNRNGVKDVGEPGIANVAITISGTAFAGTPFARPLVAADIPGGSLTIRTDANGEWRFNPIPPGIYQVTEAQPGGYLDGQEQNADPSAPAPTIGNDVFSNIVLTPFPIRGAFNFGEIRPITPVGPLAPINFFPTIDPSKRALLGSALGQGGAAPTLPTAPAFTAFSPSATRPIVFGAVGGQGFVRVFNYSSGNERFRFSPFGSAYRGDVRVATADVNGDGVPDIIAATGGGTVAKVSVFNGVSGALIRTVQPFGAGYTGGVSVAGADFNADGKAEVVVGTDAGIASTVKVFSGATGAAIGKFAPFGSTHTLGLRVATGDVNHDGTADVIVSTATGRAKVAAFSGTTITNAAPAQLFTPFLAGPAGNTTGAWVSAGDANGDGFADIVVGAGAGQPAQVVVYSGQPLSVSGTLVKLKTFTAGTATTGVRVAAADLDGDGKVEVVTGLGGTTLPTVRIFNPLTATVRSQFYAFPVDVLGGVFVA